MSIRCVILDFDGTFSDVDAEAGPFVDSFRADVLDLLGDRAVGAWALEEQEVRARPQDYGWRNAGAIVAPANADPYIRTTSIAQNLFDRFGVLKNDATRLDIVQTLYRRSYRFTLAVCKPESGGVLRAVVDRGLPVYVVTNSATDDVRKKLEKAAPDVLPRIRVRGDAKKFVLTAPEQADPRFDRLAESMRLPGLGREVALRRGRYFDALREAWTETGAAPTETLVCGDIFELDLAMPYALGCAIHLVTRPDTPEYEKAFVCATPRGTAGPDLGEMLARL